MKDKKGSITRKSITDNASAIFNEKGIGLTLDVIARMLEITKGKITNHFPTKDQLFLAILSDYEEELKKTLIEFNIEASMSNLSDYLKLLSKLMDVQYQYRCGIIYLNILSPTQTELIDHIQLNFQRNKKTIKDRVTQMSKNGLLKKEICLKENFETFVFSFVNLLTQWVIFHSMYERDKNYKETKITILKAIVLHAYGPFLTKKAIDQFENIKFKTIV